MTRLPLCTLTLTFPDGRLVDPTVVYVLENRSVFGASIEVRF